MWMFEATGCLCLELAEITGWVALMIGLLLVLFWRGAWDLLWAGALAVVAGRLTLRPWHARVQTLAPLLKP